jgi:hypothetical protein
MLPESQLRDEWDLFWEGPRCCTDTDDIPVMIFVHEVVNKARRSTGALSAQKRAKNAGELDWFDRSH